MLRSWIAAGLLLIALFVVVPSAQAQACDLTRPDVGCEATVGNCDVEAGANIVTTTGAGASADCRLGNMTRCYAEAGVGQTLEPEIERWCAV